MGMENYRVTYEDGTETYYQFDDSEDVGKAGIGALKDAAKEKSSTVKKVEKADPPTVNVERSLE
jgi:hypothetical protein